MHVTSCTVVVQLRCRCCLLIVWTQDSLWYMCGGTHVKSYLRSEGTWHRHLSFLAWCIVCNVSCFCLLVWRHHADCHMQILAVHVYRDRHAAAPSRCRWGLGQSRRARGCRHTRSRFREFDSKFACARSAQFGKICFPESGRPDKIYCRVTVSYASTRRRSETTHNAPRQTKYQCKTQDAMPYFTHCTLDARIAADEKARKLPRAVSSHSRALRRPIPGVVSG
jgi:hypothetical protein